MRAEKPTKLCKTAAEDEGEGWSPAKPVYPPPPVIIAGRPKAVLSLRFHLSLCAVVH